jgi:hypothetical protein
MTLLSAKRLVLALGIAAVMAIFGHFAAGDWAGLLNPTVLLWFGWCLLPLMLLWACGRRDDASAPVGLLLGLAVLAVAAGSWLYVDAMILNLDPQSAVAFAIVPGLQLMLIVPGLAVFWWLRRRSRRRFG